MDKTLKSFPQGVDRPVDILSSSRFFLACSFSLDVRARLPGLGRLPFFRLGLLGIVGLPFVASELSGGPCAAWVATPQPPGLGGLGCPVLSGLS